MTSSQNQSRGCLASRDLKIMQVRAWFDCKEIIVDETSNSVLKYRTPKFRALATVEVPPLAADEDIEIGWIQVCTSLKFVNQYGTTGLTSWELPELSSGVHHMVSDSDGKRYPWYGRRHEVVRLQGPLTSPTLVTVYMHDSFRPQVTWYVPVPVGADDSSAGTRCRPARLTQVRRRQHFLTYLAAVRRRSMTSSNSKATTIDNCRPLGSVERSNGYTCEGRIDTLKTVSWSVDVEIDIDPSKPLGCRVKTVGPGRQRQPTLIDPVDAPALADNALRPPNANSSQTLVWWPSSTAIKRTDRDEDTGSNYRQTPTTPRIHRLPKVVIRSVSTAVTPDAAARTYLNVRSGHVELLQAMIDQCRINEHVIATANDS